MDVQDNVKAVAARPSASPDGLRAEADGVRSASRSTPNGLRSSPPQLAPDVAMDIDHPSEVAKAGDDVDAGAKSDSEAETIVLPGKDGHSPSKKRKSIKHEDQSEDEEVKDAPVVNSPGGERGGRHRENASEQTDKEKETASTSTSKSGGKASETTTTATSTLGKRKRAKHGNIKDDHDPAHMGNSSGLSSVPTSPVNTTRSSLSKPAASDSDNSHSPSPSPPPQSRSVVRDKAKSVDRVLPRRKQYVSASGDEEEGQARKLNRQRSPGNDQRLHPDDRSSSKFRLDSNSRKRTRSISPHSHPRGHRRSISHQLPSKSSSHGLSHKKKRVPAPLQSTEYHSDESSASGSSHPRSSRLRSLAAPATGDSTTSPAKMPPHKKHVNSSGQTLLARACQKGALDVAKQRLEERPQDLNEADHALNTPLHMASIRGHADVVKFLLDKHCIVDSVNDSKDTPLHDAIENGHVEVVRLLLGAGANPSKPNRRGDEPLDLVAQNEDAGSYEGDEAVELKAAIIAAKQNSRGVRRSSEDEQMHDNADNRSSRPKESPRRSPPPFAHEVGSARSRVRTARSYKTSNDYLYQDLGPNELRKAAMEGDANVAARVLEVNPTLKDPESLFLAAKGGHFDVINILFAMGGFDPDPTPIKGVDSSTPILAAIGRDAHLKVLELLLGQDNFDPTRRIEGETYYEIAKRRAGPRLQEEEKLLKDAFEKYESNRKSTGKPRSPGLRRDGREADRDARRMAKRDEQISPSSHKRTTSSPKAKDSESSKSQQKHGLSSNQSKDGQKRGPGRPRKEDSTTSAVLSDRETPLGPPKQKSQIKRSESEPGLSENEAVVKPRRKLVSGKDLRGERELELQKKRRTSVASNASSASVKDKRGLGEAKREKSDGRVSPSVPRISKTSSSTQLEHDLASEKSSDKDRARSLKRDDSKDRLTAIRGDSPVKRPRKSATPPRSGMQEVTTNFEIGAGPQKRRKLEGEASTGHRAESTSSSSPDLKTSKSAISSGTSSGSHPKAKSSHKSAPDDVEKSSQARSAKLNSTHIHDTTSKKPKSASESPSEEDASKAAKAKEAEEARKAEARREEELEASRQKALEEKAEADRVEKAKQARLAREKAAREEEERRQQEEADRKERQRQEDEKAHLRFMEEQRALYAQQEKQKREDQERRRALQLKQQAAERARIEEEKRLERLSKLPLLLRWFDLFEDPKTQDVASLFRGIDGYRYDTIRPEATGEANAREQWMLNAHVAILLGEKDLHLSRYTAWERITLSVPAKRAIWKTKNGDFTLREPRLASFGKAFPSNDPPHKIVEENKSLFLDLDLFFVKVSEFMFIVPNFPHLRGIEMSVNYRELDVSFQHPPPPSKWKQDPDTDPNQQFAPEPKIYVNGQCIRQQDTPMTKLSHEPPPDDRRVPRRELVPVYPHEADYEELCRKQGLAHLLPVYRASPASSRHGQHEHPLEQVNGITPPRSDRTKSVNGGSPPRGSITELDVSHHLPNGVNHQTEDHAH